jgi:hypothetical protein
LAGAALSLTDIKAVGSITTKDEAAAALEASFVYAHKAIATITPENAFVAIEPVDGSARGRLLPLLLRPTGMITTVKWWSTCG